MVKAVVDEHIDGTAVPQAYRLKAAYVNDPKRLGQVLDTFPMSSVLKKVSGNNKQCVCTVVERFSRSCSLYGYSVMVCGKTSTTPKLNQTASNAVFRQVQPMGSAQRCQLHRRLISMSLAGVGPGGGGGAGGSGAGAGRGGVGSVDSWDWEDAWERMPPNLRASLSVSWGVACCAEFRERDGRGEGCESRTAKMSYMSKIRMAGTGGSVESGGRVLSKRFFG